MYTAGVVIRNYAAAGAYAANTAVYLSGADTVTQLVNTALPPLGFTMNATTGAGDRVDVAHLTTGEVIEAKAGDTVTAGKLQQVIAGGLLDDATTDNVWVVGVALNAGSVGSIVNLLCLPHVTNDVSALGGNQ